MQIPNVVPDTRSLPGDAPASADPFGGGSTQGQRNGPFSGTKSMIDLIGRVPAEHSEAVAAAGHPVPANIRDLLNAAQNSITRAPDVARQHIRAAEQVGSDDRIAQAGKQRLLTESAEAVARQLSELHEKANANLSVAEAELTAAALPRLTPGQEMVARADAQLRLNAVPASERPGVMLALARGESGDDLAGLVAGSWGRTVLQAAGLKGSDLDKVHRTITDAAAASAADSEDATRRAAAAHLRTVQQLAGSADVIGVLSRKARDEILARHGLPNPDAIRPNAGSRPRA